MRMDIGSNYTIVEAVASASESTETTYSTAIDHADGPCGAFFIACPTLDTSFISTLQHCATNSGTPGDWTDEVAGAGNDVSVTLTVSGDTDQINVPNPRNRFSRIKTVQGGTSVFGITSIIGPLRTLNAQ